MYLTPLKPPPFLFVVFSFLLFLSIKGDLTSLLFINLGANHIYGALPDTMRKLVNLESMYFGGDKTQKGQSEMMKIRKPPSLTENLLEDIDGALSVSAPLL